MRSSFVKSLVALTVVASAALLPASSAVANGKLAAVCVFTGHANLGSTPVQWVGGSGTFSFDNSGGLIPNTCAGVHNLAPDTQTIGLSASGTFTSLVCGTSNVLVGGDATGTATVTNGSGTLATADFSIPFVAGQGAILGDFTGSAGNTYAGHDGPVVGAVTIFPNNAATALVVGGATNNAAVLPPGLLGGNVASTCVDNYGVAGAFALYG